MTQRGELIKKILKWGAWLLLGFLLLFAVLYFLIQFPKIQTLLVQKVTTQLNTSLSSTTRVGRVNISLFKKIVLEEVYLEDQQKDTLLYAQQISANIGLFSLLEQKIHLNDLLIEDAILNTYRNSTDSVFNYDYLIAALQPNESSDKNTSSPPWDFNIENIYLNQVAFVQEDKKKGSSIRINAKEGHVGIRSLDIDAQVLNVDNLEINGTSIILLYPEKDTLPIATITSSLEFPTIPWQISINTIKGINNSITYQVKSQQSTPSKINYSDLILSNLAFRLEQYEWLGKTMKGQVKAISFQEQSGFSLNGLEVGIQADSTRLVLDRLIATTPNSQLKNTTRLSFQKFEDLLDFSKKVQIESSFDNTKIRFNDIHWLAADLLSSIDTEIMETLRLNGQFSGTINHLKANNLVFDIGERLQLAGSVAIQNILNPEHLNMALDIKNFSTSYKDLNTIFNNLSLPKELETFGKISLNTKAKGDLKILDVETINIQTATATQLEAKGQLQNLAQPDQIIFDIAVADFQTLAQDWKSFLKGNMPPALDSLGAIQYAGQLKGNTQKIKIDGLLQSTIGSLESDLQLALNNTFGMDSYQGDLELQDFDLGSFLNNTDIGKVSLSLKGQGRGVQLDSLQGIVQTTIENFEYKGHRYEQIIIDGQVEQKQFQGAVSSKDELAWFDFQGLVDLNTSLPKFKFELDVDTLDLQALNLIEKPLSLSGKTRMNFVGDNLDELNGNIFVEKLFLSNDSLQIYTDTLTLLSRQLNTNNKNITFTSDFLNASFKGDFKLTEIPELVNEYLQEHFPLDWLHYTLPVDTNQNIALETQNFTAKLTVEDLKFFTIIGLLPAIEIGTATLDAAYVGTEKNIQIISDVENFQYENLQFSKAQLTTDGDANQVNNRITISDFQSGLIKIPTVEVASKLIQDSLYYDVLLQRDTSDKMVALEGWMNKPDGQFKNSLKSSIILNNKKWQIPTNNGIYWDKDQLFFDQFQLSKDSQQIILQSKGDRFAQELSPLSIAFDAFPIGELLTLANKPIDFLKGNLNGTLTLNNFLKGLHFEADLLVADIILEKQSVGDLKILAIEPPNSDKIDVALDLKGKNNKGSASGYVHTKDERIDIQTTIDQLELFLLDPFLEGLVSQSKGLISGALQVQGTLGKPEMQGQLNLDSISTLVDVTQTRYDISNQTVTVNNREINLGRLKLKDTQGHQAILSGKIRHQSFTDYLLDLNIQTDEFQFLNTTALDNELFYGTLLLKADLGIKGTLEEPVVNINARTQPSSVFHLSPFSELDVITNNDYVIFASPDSLEQLPITSYQIKNTFPFDVTLNLELTKDAELQFIVDPISGDKLVCRGNSDLVIQMKPSGLIEMFGNYIVSSGQYSFSYNQLVKRKFDIKEGGTVLFNGDPLNAQFDLMANYNTRGTTYELIKSEASLSDTEIAAAQRKTDISVQLLLKGNLESPEISFDIDLPNNTSGAITDITNQKLQQLRANPDELNNQVFGLLLVNSFIISDNANTNLIGTGEDVALSSVSKLFTNQLNRLADQYIKGVEVNFDVDSYRKGANTAETTSNVTEVDIGLSKQLFNDRLTIKASGTVDLENSNQSTDFSSIAGDFLLEYKLTANGNYIIRAFRRSSFDILNSENTEKNGFSIFLKQSFDERRKKKDK